MEFVLQSAMLTKRYGKFNALNGLSINVPKGSIYGLVGKNGAGKTTLIRIICGLQKPTSGQFCLYGYDSKSKEASVARKRIGAVVETPSIYLGMSAEDNLKMQYRILGINSFETIPQLLNLVGLKDTGKKKAKNFSLGMRQRLGIAIALAGNPDFIILDEPINGLDPQGIVEMRELILRLNRERNITILISSHILEELSKLATHYGFVDGGRIVREISAEELENISRKRMKVQVSDMNAFVSVMNRLKVPFRVSGPQEAEVYAKLNITDFVHELDKDGCQLISVTEHDENLENYFINLVGGIRQ